MPCDGAGGTGGLGAAFRWIYDLWKNGIPGGGVHGDGGCATGGIAGHVFYVDGVNGLDTDLGTKNCPWKTIEKALGECVNDHDDYIIVKDCWQQDTFPIVVNKTHVHIIGIANPSGQFPKMAPAAADDNPVFQIGATGNWSEIAGFDLGGGDTSPCINLVNPVGVWIHCITFGNTKMLDGSTPQDGIEAPGGLNPADCRISDCKFLGSGGNAQGGISRDGIRVAAGGGDDFINSEICNNVFQGCPGIAIYLTRAKGALIKENDFALDEDNPLTPGAAITLGGAAAGCFVSNNRAQFGHDAMATNPYLDQASTPATPDMNHWTFNWAGNLVVYPD